MSRFNLPDIDFLDVDASEYENIGVSNFEKKTGVTLSESDPRRKFIQAVAFVATVLANNIDYTAKQNRLSYAADDYLDHIGADKNTPRLEPLPAETTIRFNVNNPEEFVIPAGTRLSVKEIHFAVVTDYRVPIGPAYVDVKAVCLDPGVIGNDFLPGQITEIVDPLPWVSSAENITTTSGGTDWEEDEPYAERIRNANESKATTGPELAYKNFAMKANQDIIDIRVISPAPNTIEIVVLMKNGEQPSEEIKNQVLAKCSARDVRPLTDLVTVTGAMEHPYSLTVSYYLPNSLRTMQNTVQTQIEASVSKYKLWQKSKLGRGIDPSELYALMQKAGAKRILVEPNEYVEISDRAVAKDEAVTVVFGGFIND